MNQGNVLPEGAQRQQGKDAQDVNIYVAKLIAGVVKSTLGPKGMDKLLVDHLGDVTVTNDGVTILREMTIENPVAKMMVEIAKTQETEVGDGTTTAVVLAGELLAKAEVLLKKKIHPTVIVKGYKMAAEKARVLLDDMKINIKDTAEYKDVLLQIARTAMTGKGAEDQRDHLAQIVVDTILKVANENEVELEDIKIIKKQGGSIKDTKIIEGIVLDKKRTHPNMPKKITDAAIVLIDAPIEIKALEMDAKINVTNPAEMQAFYASEAEQIKEMVDIILRSGANVVICSRNIDESAVHFLAKEGIYAIKRGDRQDLELISKATGANIVTSLKDLVIEDRGFAGTVYEKFTGDSDLTFIDGSKDNKSCTILVRGSTEQVTAETKRAIEDALGDIASVVREPFAVGGAGAPEILLSKALKKFALTHTGRIQLAIEAFADSMEVIPETLAENAGLDPIDVISGLKASKNKWPGIEIETGVSVDSWIAGIIEPSKIKTQAVSSAAEVAMMVLRIDDVIAIMHDPDQVKAQNASMM